MRARSAVRVRRLVRRGLTVGCGLAWWWAAVRLTLVPGARPGLGEGAVLTGWSLGLIPLHAVPVHPRISRDGPGGHAGPWHRRAAETGTGAEAEEGLGPDEGAGPDPEAAPAFEVGFVPEIAPEIVPGGALTAGADGAGAVQPPEGAGPR
ncbi:hypothetical protein [Actinacidiphila rubida]|uniref:Uncharacterized protein n=1 Tax=Actinacidiphila rubida TaxID=310780 RepID=A0A1H8G4P9_9ACTN|nr:hypothetical protein [Actinacidiphila rubida]SEN39071.1 hypothetical protein SAMN05216267_1004269 [Actinacidiphila rubida]